MKFDIENFKSPYEFALAIHLYFNSKHMLEFAGQKIVHVFEYKKLCDMSYFKEITPQVIASKSRYWNTPSTQDFDVENQVAIIIACKETNENELHIVPLENVKKMAHVERTIMITKKNGCNHCGKKDIKLKSCAKCKIVKYCSKECQCADWNNHKQTCKLIL
jgi:hypothetical protein